jgi:regulator of replication initiation timing
MSNKFDLDEPPWVQHEDQYISELEMRLEEKDNQLAEKDKEIADLIRQRLHFVVENQELKRRYEAAVRCFIAAETSARFEYGQAAPTREEAEQLIEEELSREHK